MHQATIWTNVNPDLCRHMVSLGHNELKPHSRSWVKNYTFQCYVNLITYPSAMWNWRCEMKWFIEVLLHIIYILYIYIYIYICVCVCVCADPVRRRIYAPQSVGLNYLRRLISTRCINKTKNSVYKWIKTQTNGKKWVVVTFVSTKTSCVLNSSSISWFSDG